MAEHKTLDKAAETIGRTLGHLVGRIEGWRKHGGEFTQDLRDAVSSGQEMLTQFGEQVKREAAIFVADADKRRTARTRKPRSKPKASPKPAKSTAKSSRTRRGAARP